MQLSSHGTFSFHLYNENNRATNTRTGETKLSEQLSFGEATAESKFVILGISEDIGPQMNGGFPGAANGFSVAMQALQNAQSNVFLVGDEIGVLGEVVQNVVFSTRDRATGWVEELDEFIFSILTNYVAKHQKLIVVGGGHNNAYPILKFSHHIHDQAVQSINIDPHADCRSMEYRHSGNPFSYALNEKYICDYAVFGLHEAYNNAFILNFLKEQNCTSSYFEAYLDNPETWWEHFRRYINQLKKDIPTCLDIDLDALAFCPSSALTPSGFSIEEVRRMIRFTAQQADINTLHLPEGAPKTEQEMRLYGKMIAYFILDFVKSKKV